MSLRAPTGTLWALLQPVYMYLLGPLVVILDGVEGTTLTSWFRTVRENTRVGGHPESQHLLGLSFDITGPDLDAIEARARDVWPGVVIRTAKHVHLQALPAGAIPPTLIRLLSVA